MAKFGVAGAVGFNLIQLAAPAAALPLGRPLLGAGARRGRLRALHSFFSRWPRTILLWMVWAAQT